MEGIEIKKSGFFSLNLKGSPKLNWQGVSVPWGSQLKSSAPLSV